MKKRFAGCKKFLDAARTHLARGALLVVEEAFCSLKSPTTRNYHENFVEARISGCPHRRDPGIAGSRPRDKGPGKVRPQG